MSARPTATPHADGTPLRDPQPPAPVPVWLVLLFALLWFAPLGYRDLVSPDEGRYAELSREMLVTGDWITPRLNGLLYFEKPALQYWAGAIAFAVFGVGEFAARLWPALTGALAIVATWWVAHRAWGARTGAWAAGVLVSSAWWVANGHFLSLDMGLSAFLTIAMVAFWHAQRDQATAGENRAGMLVVWAAIALAVLSKGLIGMVIPGAALVLYSLVERDARIWTRMHWLAGLALFAVIAVPWFVLVSMRNPEFARFFFVHEHFERFLTPTHRRTGPWWFFFDDLLLGLLPWTTLLPGALVAGWRRAPGRFQPGRLLVIWAVFVFVFFSASSSKLPSYILPMFGALALLIARHAAQLPARRLAMHAAAVALLGGLLAITLWSLPQWLSENDTGFRNALLDYRRWLLVATALLCVMAAWAAVSARAGRRDRPIALLALAGLATTQLVINGHQSYTLTSSARVMAEAVAPLIDADTPVYSVTYYDQTLPFYLGRPVTIASFRDEFDLGLRAQPHLGIDDVAGFEQAWLAAPRAAATIPLPIHADLAARGLPMREVYRDSRRVMVVKPAP